MESEGAFAKTETSIFLKVWGVYKKYRDWSYIYQDKNE